MTTDLEALVIAGYVFADEHPVPARPGRPAKVSDAELVALAVCQAAKGISSDRQFLGLVGPVLPGWFPHLPEQSQYNRRLRRLVELLAAAQQRLACWLDSGGARLADGTLIEVANYPGCAARSRFAGAARYGYAKSQHRYLYGLRLVLVSDRRGLPLGYTLAPASEKEYEPVADLLTGTEAELLVADKGFRVVPTARGSPAAARRCSRRRRSACPPPRARARRGPARDREIFANLKGQMRLDRHLAKTPAGLAARIPQRLLALTLAMLLNTLAGRPARAVAAYDGL
jgi:DDE family transposase